MDAFFFFLVQGGQKVKAYAKCAVVCSDVENNANSRILIRLPPALKVSLHQLYGSRDVFMNSPRMSIAKKKKALVWLKMCRNIITSDPRSANVTLYQRTRRHSALSTSHIHAHFLLPVYASAPAAALALEHRSPFTFVFIPLGQTMANKRATAGRQKQKTKQNKKGCLHAKERVLRAPAQRPIEQQRRKPRARTTAITGRRRH